MIFKFCVAEEPSFSKVRNLFGMLPKCMAAFLNMILTKICLRLDFQFSYQGLAAIVYCHSTESFYCYWLNLFSLQLQPLLSDGFCLLYHSSFLQQALNHFQMWYYLLLNKIVFIQYLKRCFVWLSCPGAAPNENLDIIQTILLKALKEFWAFSSDFWALFFSCCYLQALIISFCLTILSQPNSSFYLTATYR